MYEKTKILYPMIPYEMSQISIIQYDSNPNIDLKYNKRI